MTLYTLAQLGHAPRSVQRAANMPSGSESSSDDSDDAAPRPKRPRRSDGSDDDALLPLNDPRNG